MLIPNSKPWPSFQTFIDAPGLWLWIVLTLATLGLSLLTYQSLPSLADSQRFSPPCEQPRTCDGRSKLNI